MLYDEELPSAAQIRQIEDVGVLENLRDDVDLAVARIESDLEWREGDDDWANRARGALAHFQHRGRVASRQIEKIKASAQPQRQRKECHELSWSLIDNEIVYGGETEADLVKAVEDISCALEALEADKADEARQSSVDLVWMADANRALRQAKALRHELRLKAAAIKKQAKQKSIDLRDSARERIFIEQAREFLPRETFLTLWNRVDRIFIEKAPAT